MFVSFFGQVSLKTISGLPDCSKTAVDISMVWSRCFISASRFPVVLRSSSSDFGRSESSWLEKDMEICSLTHGGRVEFVGKDNAGVTESGIRWRLKGTMLPSPGECTIGNGHSEYPASSLGVDGNASTWVPQLSKQFL